MPMTTLRSLSVAYYDSVSAAARLLSALRTMFSPNGTKSPGTQTPHLSINLAIADLCSVRGPSSHLSRRSGGGIR